MSTPNRTKVLFGFGALVAVLIVAIVMWPTNVQREDATGAIGAVQKHRAPQITPQDVVLGNEDVKHQQKVLYADFLADAAKLRAIGSLQNPDLAALGALRDDINVRYYDELQSALAYADELASRTSSDVRSRAIRDIGEIRGRLPGRRQLRAADMANLNTEFGSLGRLVVIAAESPMESMAKAANALASAKKELETAPLETRSAEIRRQLEEADAEIGSAAKAHQISLSDESDYLIGLRDELKAIEDFDLLSKESANMQAAHSDVLAAADALEARARHNIGQQAEMESALLAHLNAIGSDVDALSHMMANQMNAAGTQELSHALNSVELSLRTYDAQFKAQAQSAVRDQMAAAKGLDDKTALASLGVVERQLSAMQR